MRRNDLGWAGLVGLSGRGGVRCPLGVRDTVDVIVQCFQGRSEASKQIPEGGRVGRVVQ